MLLAFTTTHLGGANAPSPSPSPCSLAAYCSFVHMFPLSYNTEWCIVKLLKLQATTKCTPAITKSFIEHLPSQKSTPVEL